MNFIKSLIADSMHGIVPADIPFMLFRLFLAGLIGYYLFILLKRKQQVQRPFLFPVVAMLAAMFGLIVEYSMPLALISLPALILLYPKEKVSGWYQVILAATVGAGVGCGTGHAFVVVLAILLISPIIYFTRS